MDPRTRPSLIQTRLQTVWFRNEPVGVNTVSKFMKNLSKSAGLSKEYTNHCIRSTTITLLNHCGFKSRHIATVGGHRNQASLASYCYDTSDSQKKAMSNALSMCTNSVNAIVPLSPKPDRGNTAGCNTQHHLLSPSVDLVGFKDEELVKFVDDINSSFNNTTYSSSTSLLMI